MLQPDGPLGSHSYRIKKNTSIYQCRIATGNAIANATVPVMDAFCAGEKNAYTTLDASGLSVGLPAGLMGNSEVGHLNIGAGRVLYQVTLFLEYVCKKLFCTCGPKWFTLPEPVLLSIMS